MDKFGEHASIQILPFRISVWLINQLLILKIQLGIILRLSERKVLIPHTRSGALHERIM